MGLIVQVMSSLLTGDNINLLDLANTDTVKTQLFANTSRQVHLAYVTMQI